MANWTKEHEDCYKRHVLGGLYKSDPCKTMINNYRCENILKNGEKCAIYKKMMLLYAQIGPPRVQKKVEVELEKTPEVIFSPIEQKIIDALKKAGDYVDKYVIGQQTEQNPAYVSSIIARINKKQSGLIEKRIAEQQKAYYKMKEGV